MLPLPSYVLHITPHPSTVNDTPKVSTSICGTSCLQVPPNGKDLGPVVRSGGNVEDGRGPAGRHGPAEGPRGPLWHSCGDVRGRSSSLNGKRPAEAGLFATCGVPVVRNGGRGLGGEDGGGQLRRTALPSRAQDSPRCLSSQRSSRLLMNELLGLPDFRAAPAALALPAAEPRIVA